MPMNAHWRPGGSLKSRRSAERRWQLKIFSQKPAAGFGSFLGGGLRQNSAGYLVRDDLPLQMPVVPIVVAPLPGLTYPWVHDRQASSKRRGGASRSSTDCDGEGVGRLTRTRSSRSTGSTLTLAPGGHSPNA